MIGLFECISLDFIHLLVPNTLSEFLSDARRHWSPQPGGDPMLEVGWNMPGWPTRYAAASATGLEHGR
jgi:hypothetical protein